MPLPVSVVRAPSVNKPLTASGPFTPSVAPELVWLLYATVKLLLIVEAESIVRVPPLSATRVLAGDAVDRVISGSCVTVMSDRSMTALSDAVGTCWSLGLAELTQLLAVSQSPPAGLIQFIVASKVRSSSWPSAGRKPLRRFARRRMERLAAASEVCDERLNFRARGFS